VKELGHCHRLTWTATGLILLLGLAACGQESWSGSLDGSSWELETLNGRDLAPGTTITLVFDDGTFYGYGGCNAYGRLAQGGSAGSGQYQATPEGALAFRGLAIDNKACPAPVGVMDQEKAYIEALSSAASFQLRGDRLEIFDADGFVVLLFSP
jgi:heat shock protein HslJ